MFMRGRMHVPFPVRGDAYTIAGQILASEAASNASLYNVVFRYSPADVFPEVANDSRIVLYGLTDYIRTNLTKRITRDDVNESAAFMARAKIGGGGLPFVRKLWDDVVEKFDGYIPVRIKALPEGSTFFPNEPVVSVKSLYKGYGEIAAMLEAVMLGQVATATTRATVYRHWLERITEWLRLPAHAVDTYKVAQWYIHDFGMRASSVAEESEMFGRAHLLSFKGTDTFNAAYQAWRMGCNDDTGRSILALAHRIVQGYDKEIDCYINLMKADNIGSYVADCYNFKRAIADMIVPLAKQNPSKIFVSRPDSGDMSENTRWVIEQTQKQETPNVSLIHGDSVKPLISKEQIDIAWEMGVNPATFMLFGVGGYGRNTATRDALSASYKLSAIRKEEYSRWSPVVKLSDSITKLSVPGPNKIIREAGLYSNTVRCDKEDFAVDARVVYYDGAGDSVRDKFKPACYEPFNVIEDRVLNGFNNMSGYPANYGTHDNTPWSQAIKNIQSDYVKNYKD